MVTYHCYCIFRNSTWQRRFRENFKKIHRQILFLRYYLNLGKKHLRQKSFFAVIVHNNPELFSQQIDEIIMDLTLVKLNDGFMIGKPNTLTPSLNADHVKTNDNMKQASLIFWRRAKQTTLTKSKTPDLFKNLSQLSMSTSEVKS